MSSRFYLSSQVPGSELLIATNGGLTSGLFSYTTISSSPISLSMSGVASASVGVCSLMTYSSKDLYGFVSPVSSSKVITAGGKSFATYYSNSACSSVASTATLTAGTYSAAIYLKGSTAETLTLTGVTSGLSSATFVHTLLPASATKLALTGASTLINGSCGIYSVQSRDTNSNLVNVSSDTTVNLGGNGVGAFYSDSGCTSTITSTIITNGTSSKTFYFKAASAASFTFTATDNAAVLTAATGLAVATRATNLVMTGPVNVIPGVCSAVYTLTNQNIGGTPVNVGTTQTITLAGKGTGAFYSDAACTAAVTSVSMTAGTSSKTFYFKGVNSEFLTFTATNSTMATASLNVSAGAFKLAISGATSVNANTCSAAYTVTSQDGVGAVANVIADTTITLVGSGAGGFYSDSGCSTPITALTILSGTSSNNFYFKDRLAENLIFQTSATGYTSTSLAVSSVATSATRLSVAGSTVVPVSTCSQPFTVGAVDALSNPRTFSSNTTITLSGAGGSGAFYSDAACTNSISSLAMSSGDSNAVFYFKGSAPETSLTLSLTDSSGLTGVSKNIFVTSGISQVAAGGEISCALKSGAVWCWGNNASGVVGGSLEVASQPTQIPDLTGVSQLAVGQSHVCALKSGTVWCWGDNSYGQLGPAVLDSRSAIPQQVTGLTGITKISSGPDASTTCALLSDQTVKCWGLNTAGQFGNGTLVSSNVPTQVLGLTGVTDLSTGPLSTCVVANGGVKCWGQPSAANTSLIGDGTGMTRSIPTQVVGLGDGSGATRVITLAGSSCAVVNGGVQCWGVNSSNELGNGTTTSTRVPVQVSGLPSGSGVTEISGGSSHVCAIATGALKCWGTNSSVGALGLGDNVNHSTATTVIASGVTQIAAGSYHTCILVNGSMQCWGSNSRGQLGLGEIFNAPSPGWVTGLGASSGVTAVTAGSYATCAIVNGDVKCWGLNESGQLGNSSQTNSSTPVSVVGVATGVDKVVALNNGFCALQGGGVRCWGSSLYGALGTGTADGTLFSIGTAPVGLDVGSGVTDLSANGDRACVVVSGGVQCWGVNSDDSFGLGDPSTLSSPTQLTSLPSGSGVVAVATGSSGLCVLSAQGDVKCQGYNLDGRLGDGSRLSRSTPVDISLRRPAVSIHASNASYCAVLDDGGLQCWGGNGIDVPVGTGQIATATAPFDIALTLATDVSSFLGTTCAVINSGVKCWGQNKWTQTGSASTETYVLSPVAIPELPVSSGVTAVSSGRSHSCAVVNGGVQCWGSNTAGELGTGTSPALSISLPSAVRPF